ATLADLDNQAAVAFLARIRSSRPYFRDLSEEDALRRARVIVDSQDGRRVPSLGGLLALGRYPQDYFPQLNLTFVHYPTVDGGEPLSGDRFLDNRLIEGPIPVMV